VWFQSFNRFSDNHRSIDEEMSAEDNPHLMVQCVGAIIMFFAARMCHIAFVSSIDVWYSSPTNRHKYIRAFKDQFRETGKPDYTAFMKTHPETISETFGDEGTSEGQMVKAIVLPSCIIMAIGGIMMRCGGSSMWGYTFHAARGLLTPFGLLMVLQTPVVSGATGGNKDIRAGKKVSSIELLYQMNWVMLHMIGFFAFLGPAVIIELPVALYEIITGAGGLSSLDEGPFIKHYRLVLAVMRVLCAILLLFAAPFLATTKTRNPNTLAALKWRAEFTVGEFGATQMYFNALSVFFQPGVGPYSWLDLGLLGLLSLEAFRIFCVHGVFWLVVMNRWDSIDWAGEMKRRVPAQGPVMQGLRTLTGDELTHMHAVQAGVPDFSEWIVKASKYLPASLVATGCKYDKFRLLVVKPDNYENFRAMEFHELSSDDLDNWNKDLSRVSSAFESADTVFFPYGLYKMDMMHPKALLSLSKYQGDVKKIGPDVVPNEAPVPNGEDHIGMDITEKVLSDSRGAFLKDQSLEAALQETGKAVGLYSLMGEMCQEIADANKDKAEEGARSGSKSAPLLVDNPSLGFEVQIRGIKKSNPAIVMRIPKDQVVPKSWGALAKAAAMPDSTK